MKAIKPSELKPNLGYVLVEPVQTEAKTASGLYLPESDEEKPQQGKVLACGGSVWENGVKEIKCPVSVGDVVIYKKWGGNDFKLDDVEYQFLKFDDILAVVSKK
ncbi:MAG TPA: co-chaperone GroES [Candidatus Woesebacteria bacterium]|nr:co-chaperone GroES [Candidatus Woesebacteria bacterium]